MNSTLSTATTTTTTAATGVPGDLVASGPVTVTESGTVIENRHFIGSGDQHCVMINGASDVTVRNSRFTNCHKGVYALNASNVVVTDNVFEANMSDRGRNAVQFDKVSGGYVARNQSTVTNGATKSEDHISMFKSNGTSSAPIVIEDNVLVGGGPSTSGSGIMLGDGGGSWQIARNNTLIDPGQVGIGASGGSYITVADNRVTSDSHPWSNVGIFAWDWDGSGCANVLITGNQVSWVKADGSQNSFWNGQNCSNLNIDGNSWQ
jgi:hypothetical protein